MTAPSVYAAENTVNLMLHSIAGMDDAEAVAYLQQPEQTRRMRQIKDYFPALWDEFVLEARNYVKKAF